MSANNPEDKTSAAIAKSVRELMQRKGIPKRGQTKTLKEILNLSLSQAYRKINGEAPWEIAQLRQVAEHYGEPLDVLDNLFSPKRANELAAIPGVFVVEKHEFSCKVQLGPILRTTKNVEFVARQSKSGGWVITESRQATVSGGYYRVKKLELVVDHNRKLSVAVLDDDAQEVNNLCEHLEDNEFDTHSFYDLDTLTQTVTEGKKGQFDAYILDWLIEGKTVEPLIKLIRSKEDPTTPIFLLTGEIVTGRARETDVARVIVEYNVTLYEKPTRLRIIAAQLSKALGVE